MSKTPREQIDYWYEQNRRRGEKIKLLEAENKELKEIYLGQIRVIARSRITHKEKVERMVALAEQALESEVKKDKTPRRYLRICPKCQHNDYMAVMDKVCEKCQAESEAQDESEADK